MDQTGDGSALVKYIETIWDAGVTWDSVDWLRSLTSLPVVLKGVLTTEDAHLAAERDVDGLVVSNHGGRQLDGAIATADALADIADAVGHRVELFVDGGIRRGGDVLKALALGARAVLIGRPYLWGLALDGEAGVGRMLDLLRAELDLSLALAGYNSVQSVTRSLVK
jgi:4-hydroxymandelate oxidase